MPIPFACESCGRSLNVRDELAGQQIYCPDCKSILTVPNWSAPPEEVNQETAPPQDDFAARAEELPPQPAMEPELPRPLPTPNTGPRVGAIVIGLLMLGAAAAILIFQLDAGKFHRAATRLMVFLFIAGIAVLIKGATGSKD